MPPPQPHPFSNWPSFRLGASRPDMPEHSLFTKAIPTEPLKPTWTSLPQEIKSHILSFADLSDLKEARLVCWNWADTASPFLFEELWLTPWTLCRLEDKRSLQTIHPHTAYNGWQDSFEKNIDLPLLSDADDSERVAVTEVFNKRKQPWLASEVDARFNSYSDHFRCQARYFGELGVDDHSGATAGKTLPVLEEVINSVCNLSEVTIGDDHWFQYFQSSYTLGHSYYSTGKRWSVWEDLEDLNGPIFHRDLPSFGHTFLSTQLADHFVVLDNDWSPVIHNENVVGQTWLADVLSAAEKLHDIHVIACDYEIRKDIMKLFWSRQTMLWDLTFANMAITEDLFSSFLHKNAQTLQDIRLNRVSTTRYPW
ncbi:MAG: hypothetical protein Q9203_004058 [Teloschistes exilis]